MSHILVCCIPNPGHVRPMLAVSRHLASVGHKVTVNTAELFREQVEKAGLRFVPFAGKADIDYRDGKNAAMKKNMRMTDTSSADALKQWLTGPLPDQHAVIQKILKESTVDLIITDTGFFGAFPLLLGPKEKRPPVLCCGVNPLMLRSADDEIPSPTATPEDHQQLQAEKLEMAALFEKMNDDFALAIAACGAPPLPASFDDLMYTLPDLFLQFTGEVFEFPRSNMPATLHFVGPVWPNQATDFKEPAWWSKLDGSKPIVVVTQGTLTNGDLNELIQPTLLALAEDDVFVIAVTGGADFKGLTVPTNAVAEGFVPFDRLLPKVDVLVTNGGYGSIQQAMSLGVPAVVGGDGEKGFSAARVAWTKAGINLKTGNPTQEQIGTAVRTILADKRYRENAQRVQRNFAQHDAFAEIARHVDSLLIQAQEERLTALAR